MGRAKRRGSSSRCTGFDSFDRPFAWHYLHPRYAVRAEGSEECTKPDSSSRAGPPGTRDRYGTIAKMAWVKRSGVCGRGLKSGAVRSWFFLALGASSRPPEPRPAGTRWANFTAGCSRERGRPAFSCALISSSRHSATRLGYNVQWLRSGRSAAPRAAAKPGELTDVGPRTNEHPRRAGGAALPAHILLLDGSMGLCQSLSSSRLPPNAQANLRGRLQGP